MMYWQKEIETMDRKDLVKFQLERLKQTIELAGNSPFYHKIFKEKGITPDSFQSLEDLQKLPFTTKDDLRNNYPFGLAAIPLQKCVRIHSSSGTTGNPTVVLHSAKDLDQWANQVARCTAGGGRRGHGGRRGADLLRLRHVYRWPRFPVWSRKIRCVDSACGGR